MAGQVKLRLHGGQGAYASVGGGAEHEAKGTFSIEDSVEEHGAEPTEEVVTSRDELSDEVIEVAL